MQARWTQVIRLLQDFQALLAPEVMQLKLERGVDCLSTDRLTQKCPALKREGVYLIFDENEKLVYIGSAANQPLVKRVRNQIFTTRFGTQPRWIDIIPFDSRWSFFIPALELYLIRKVVKESGSALVNKIGTFAGLIEWLIESEEQGSG